MADGKKTSKAKSDADIESLGYADAVAELEDILDGLESETIDVDVLADRVKDRKSVV